MNKWKERIIGFIFGIIFFSTIAYAAQSVTWRNGGGNDVGTSANPIVIELI